MSKSPQRSVKAYLDAYFLPKARFAELAQVAPDRLEALIALEAVSQPTYICTGQSIRSAAFGETDIDENVHGEFFRPECARWVEIANCAPAGQERSAVLDTLRSECRAALREELDNAEVEARIDRFLPHFWSGTFGLCVADPSSGAGIVRKERLQERLTQVTDQGINSDSHGLSPREILALIDEYERASMPFSPVEYERSSRKRFVEDLRKKLE